MSAAHVDASVAYEHEGADAVVLAFIAYVLGVATVGVCSAVIGRTLYRPAVRLRYRRLRKRRGFLAAGGDKDMYDIVRPYRVTAPVLADLREWTDVGGPTIQTRSRISADVKFWLADRPSFSDPPVEDDQKPITDDGFALPELILADRNALWTDLLEVAAGLRWPRPAPGGR